MDNGQTCLLTITYVVSLELRPSLKIPQQSMKASHNFYRNMLRKIKVWSLTSSCSTVYLLISTRYQSEKAKKKQPA